MGRCRVNGEHVFRCDYCGCLVDIDEAVCFFTPVDIMPDGAQLYTPAVYYGQYCGRTATARAGAGRG